MSYSTKRVAGRRTRDHLRGLGGGRSAEVTAFSNGMSSGHYGWVAATSMIWAAGKASIGGVSHGGFSKKRWMHWSRDGIRNVRQGGWRGEVGYQDHLDESNLCRLCDMWRGARKRSVKSDGTLKHSNSLTWYDALRDWDPMNFLMS